MRLHHASRFIPVQRGLIMCASTMTSAGPSRMTMPRNMGSTVTIIAGSSMNSSGVASLAVLEKAIREEGPDEVELAIRRILLIHGVILTAGGIPLIYLGDEIGTLNNYTYRDDPAHERDSR